MTRSLVMRLWLVFGAIAAAADLTGTWRLDLNPDFGGVDQALICAFMQDDTTLSANCEGGQFTGKMEGSRVTLQIKTGRNDESTATFEGTTNQTGTTISGTWHLADSIGERTGKFTLTKR